MAGISPGSMPEIHLQVGPFSGCRYVSWSGSVSFVLECLTYPIQLGREDGFLASHWWDMLVPIKGSLLLKKWWEDDFYFFFTVVPFLRASICLKKCSNSGWIVCWCQNTTSITTRVERRFLWVVEGYPIDAVLLDQKDSGRILSH